MKKNKSKYQWQNKQNKAKYEKAKKIVDTMVYNYETDDYEFVSDRCKREYSDITSKAQLIGILNAKSDYTNVGNYDRLHSLQVRLQEIEWLINQYGEWLYLPDSVYKSEVYG